MKILAAGSLRAVWQPLMACFQAETIRCDFGPAGLLRERIEAGEPCDFFASANVAHPQALLASGRALSVSSFALNRLCLTVRADAMREGDDWRSLLMREDLRIGTSTPGCDPSGDYTQQLFSRMGAVSKAIRWRIVALVRSRDSLPLPTGALPAQWFIDHDYTGILLLVMPAVPPDFGKSVTLRIVDIPAPLIIAIADYAVCLLCRRTENRFAEFLFSTPAGLILLQHPV